MLTLGILISGRGSNMEAILRAVKRRRIPIRPAVVISSRADAPGLGIAGDLGVETEVVESRGFAGTRAEYDSMVIGSLVRHGVTPRNGLVCLAGFMRIIGPAFAAKYRNRIMNIHPALLPAFPGLGAQGQAIDYGAKVSGCSVHFVDEGMDTGPVISQAVVPVRRNDTAESLSRRILKEEHRIYPEAVGLVARGKIRVLGRRTVIG